MPVRSTDYDDDTSQPMMAPIRRGIEMSSPTPTPFAPPTRKAFSMTEYLIRGATSNKPQEEEELVDPQLEKDDSVVFEPDSTHSKFSKATTDNDDDLSIPGTPSTASMEEDMTNSPTTSSGSVSSTGVVNGRPSSNSNINKDSIGSKPKMVANKPNQEEESSRPQLQPPRRYNSIQGPPTTINTTNEHYDMYVDDDDDDDDRSTASGWSLASRWSIASAPAVNSWAPSSGSSVVSAPAHRQQHVTRRPGNSSMAGRYHSRVGGVGTGRQYGYGHGSGGSTSMMIGMGNYQPSHPNPRRAFTFRSSKQERVDLAKKISQELCFTPSTTMSSSLANIDERKETIDIPPVQPPTKKESLTRRIETIEKEMDAPPPTTDRRSIFQRMSSVPRFGFVGGRGAAPDNDDDDKLPSSSTAPPLPPPRRSASVQPTTSTMPTSTTPTRLSESIKPPSRMYQWGSTYNATTSSSTHDDDDDQSISSFSSFGSGFFGRRAKSLLPSLYGGGVSNPVTPSTQPQYQQHDRNRDLLGRDDDAMARLRSIDTDRTRNLPLGPQRHQSLSGRPPRIVRDREAEELLEAARRRLAGEDSRSTKNPKSSSRSSSFTPRGGGSGRDSVTSWFEQEQEFTIE